MAITIGSENIIYTGSNIIDFSATVANDDIIVSFWQDIGVSPEEVAFILYNRQTLTAGSKSTVESAIGYNGLVAESIRIVENSTLVLYEDSADNDGYGRIITNSGLVPAQQPEAEFLDAGRARDMVTAKHTDLAVGLLVYRDDEDALQTVFTKFTVAAGNVSFAGRVEATNSPTAVPQALAHWTGNKYAFAAYLGSMNLRILDTTTGVTEHSVQSEGSHTDVSWAALSRIDDTRLLCFWFDNSGRNFYAAVATLTGTATITYGSVLTVHDGTVANVTGTTILKRDNNTFVIGYNIGGGSRKFESLVVSGATVSKLGDSATQAMTENGLFILGFEGTDGALVYAAGNDIKYRTLSNLPALSSGQARFYHGLGGLSEKFTLPFAGVQPQAMTLDKSLGTVVMGANAPADQPIIYSTYPYTTGTVTSAGFPTGSSVSALKWI